MKTSLTKDVVPDFRLNQFLEVLRQQQPTLERRTNFQCKVCREKKQVVGIGFVEVCAAIVFFFLLILYVSFCFLSDFINFINDVHTYIRQMLACNTKHQVLVQSKDDLYNCKFSLPQPIKLKNVLNKMNQFNKQLPFAIMRICFRVVPLVLRCIN